MKSGGLATDNQLSIHSCLAKVTVATHYKQETTATVYVALIISNVLLKLLIIIPITC